MKVSVPSGTEEVHGSDMECAGIRVSGLAFSALWLVPSPKWEYCIFLHHFVCMACVLEPAQHQTNEYKIVCRRE